jgi:hypothetical protein
VKPFHFYLISGASDSQQHSPTTCEASFGLTSVPFNSIQKVNRSLAGLGRASMVVCANVLDSGLSGVRP